MTRIIPITIALALAAGASALEIDTTWGHRVAAYGWSEPPPSVIEGSITGTFVGDEPIDLVGGDPRFERISDTTFRRRFTWNESGPVLGVFRGRDSGAVDSVWAAPAPEPPLVPGAHAFPVVSIDTEPAHLWSDATGIYVWGDMAPNWDQRGEEWERPSQTIIWDADGTPLAIRPTGLRINGGWTRCLPQKSLRLYFDREDQSPLEHDLFGAGPTASARLLLRQTVWCQFLLKDHWATSLYRDLGHLTSRWTPAVAFLDGEYWGAYALRERLDEEWATVTLGLDPDAIVMVKDGETILGDEDAWPAFLNWVDAHPDPGAHAFFLEMTRRLDLAAYTDWLFLNIMAMSGENGFHHNLVVVRWPDGRWRTVMWDEDNIIYEENLQVDMFRFYSANDAAEYGQNWPPFGYYPQYEDVRLYCRLFRQLLGNAEYRALFADRAADLLAGRLSIDAMQARMDSVLTLFSPELPLHAPRFVPYTDLDDLDDNAALYADLLAQRHPIVTAQLADFLDEHMDPVELSEFTATARPGRVDLRWRTERERENAGFEVWRAVGDPDDLGLLASYVHEPALMGAAHSDTARVYAWADASAPDDTPVWYQLRHVTRGGQTVVHDWLERVGPAPLPPLVVNEFMADNDNVVQDEAGEYDDWLELYNAGAEPVALDGLYLTDDSEEPLQWPLPPGALGPGEFLLVWCDDDPDQGPLHASFKLSRDGEEIGLYLLEGGEPHAVDLVVFGEQTTDVSQGRLPDGGEHWEFLFVPTPGSGNYPNAAPAAAPAALTIRGITPNPGEGPARIRFALGRPAAVRAAVYDLRGRLVRRLEHDAAPAADQAIVWDRRDAGGRPVAAGTYVLRLTAGGAVATAKIGVVR